MEYVIKILEQERRALEDNIRQQDLMHKNMKQATLNLKNINKLKRAMKLLRAKTRLQG